MESKIRARSSSTSRSKSSNVQPPWDRKPSSSSSTIDRTPSYNGSNGYPVTPSPVPSPMHIRTSSVSASPYTSSPADRSHATFPSSSSASGRRHSQSGPLPVHHGEKPVQDFTVRRYSSSGPLPSSNPYSSDCSVTHESPQSKDSGGYSEVFPPLKTPPPWSDLRQAETTATNPYLNPTIYDNNTLSPGGLSSSNNTLSPSTPQGVSPNLRSRKLAPSSLFGNADAKRGINGDVREVAGQLYSNKQPDCFSASSTKPSTSSDNQVPNATSSLEEAGPRSLSTVQPSGGIEANRNVSSSALALLPKPAARKAPVGILNRSLTVYVSDAGGKPPPSFSRSMSFDSGVTGKTQDRPQTLYTKASSLVDEVVERLVGHLVSRQDRPNVLADMIFATSKLTNTGVLVSPFSAARLLVERILLVQLRALSPKLMVIASDSRKFERQKWARGQKNGKNQESKSNHGLRLLRLQKRFVEIGLDTFDVLCKLQHQLPDLVAEDVSTGQGTLRIACIGGGPGCSAVALHLFFLRLFPCLEIQVSISSVDAEWKELVDFICLKGIGFVDVELLEIIRHPSLLRSYKLIAFVNSLGEEMNGGAADAVGQWQGFWNKLYQNTTAMVLIIIYESGVRWEEMMPNRGQWWCSSVRDQDSVHIVRKI